MTTAAKIECMNYSDEQERKIGEAFKSKGIDFIHESEDPSQKLDFYLPWYNVYIEVKQYHAERIGRQMASADNVIAIQGKESVEFFIKMLK